MLKRKSFMEKYLKREDNGVELIVSGKTMITSDTHFRLMIENLSEVIYEIDERGIITFISPSIEKLVGFSPSEITGKPVTDFIGGNKSFLLERIKLLKEKNEIVGEYPVRAGNDKIHWIRFSTKAVCKDGIFMGGIGTLIDVSDHKESEFELKKSEEKYRLLAENIMDVIWVLNLSQNRFTYISPSVFSLRGFTVEEAMKQGIEESLTPGSVEQVLKSIRERLNEFIANPDEKHYYTDELQQICKDRGPVWIETVTRFQYNPDGEIEVIGVSRSIEKRKAAELLLKKSEENFKAIANYTAGWESWFDLQGKLVWVNPFVKEFTGYTAEECLAAEDFVSMLVDPRDLMRIRMKLQEALKGSKGENLEYRIVRKDGSKFWLSVSWQPIFDANGNHIGVRTSGKDITVQKKSQEALAKSEALYRTLLQASPDVIVLTELTEGRIQLVSPRAYEVFRMQEDVDCQKYTLFDFLDPSEHAKAVELMTRMQEGPLGAIEYKARRMDGSTFDIEVNSDLIWDENGHATGQLIIVRDITDRKRAEIALKKSEMALKETIKVKDKLFSIIAHDLRGNIGSIMQGLDMISGNSLDEEFQNQLLEQLIKSSKVTFNLLENLLNWAKIQTGTFKVNPQNFSLIQAVWENVDLVSPQAQQKNIRINVNADQVHIVYADIDSISLILRNLLMNAVKFTPHNGSIDISLSDSAEFVKLQISDTGVGMDPQKVESLFSSNHLSSFGTDNEKGSGIGLLLVKEFVVKNGGAIHVESEPGKGSRFILFIPAGKQP